VIISKNEFITIIKEICVIISKNELIAIIKDFFVIISKNEFITINIGDIIVEVGFGNNITIILILS
jgi:hypothetical protein